MVFNDYYYQPLHNLLFFIYTPMALQDSKTNNYYKVDKMAIFQSIPLIVYKNKAHRTMGDDKFIRSQYMKENVMSKVIDKLGEEMVDTIMTAYYDAIKEITVTDSD